MSKDEEREKEWPTVTMYSQHPSLRKLEPLEKQYLLSVERGDAARVTRLLQLVHKSPSTKLDINCKDPVGRSATLMAIDNENLEMLELLLDNDVESRDALLHAINAEYVEAVDLLLEHEEAIYKEGEPHSWEKVDRDISTFTPEITPLILAAHKDNYEILKILLDRGATLPMPHDVRCKCQDCLKAMEEDCLCHSRSRINAYRALSSPSLICLSSIDPILTAFELSWELRRLSMAENEFKEDYVKLRSRCQDFATALLDHARSSRELEMVLNYDPMRPPYQHGEHMPLARLEMALKYKQKKFVAHPNVQQLLTTLWYDGLPGFRRQNPISQLWTIIKIGALFPFYSVVYMTFPNTNTGRLVKKPFFKFIMHSFSYLFFLLLLILASQRVETVIAQWFGSEEMQQNSNEALKRQRGQPPTLLETTILLYIIAHIWQETREVWTKGIINYFHNLWNFIDFTRNGLYVGTAGMRLLAYFQAQAEISENPMAVYIPREAWNPYDPMLIADGLFAAGNIFAALKLVHIFSINPYLGPLQISLGRMVIDIIKFFFIYALVLFAFACGLNQLLWYYADMEKQQCFSGPNGTENWTQQRDSCLAWRRFSNLFESSQTLFWASFGLVDLSNFELTGIKSYTRFWGLLMFGSYSVINVVVLLNLLIAMMSNSYNIISERADVEWKFARTTLFMNYFEEGNTAPPPFNIFPTCKHVLRLFKKQNSFKDMSIRRKQTKMKERDSIYQSVMCNLVWRYVTAEQKDAENHPVTEDNINELRQDVYSFRHELMRVLKNSGMKTRDIEKDEVDVTGKRVQSSKRRLIKDFSIGLMEVCTDEAAPEVLSNKSVLARFVGRSTTETRSSQRWKDLIQAAKRSKIIGNRDNGSIRFGSLKRNKSDEELSENKLRETMEMEFQKSEKFEHPAENKLYPNIPEEDLIKCTENTVAPIIIQPKVNLPLGSTEISKIESCITNKNCLIKEIKLSPEALMKNVVKREKYQAPKPIVPNINEPTSPASKNIGNHSTKNAENIQNSTSKQNNVAINSNGKAVSNDTKITVTSSPEKISSPRNSSMTSVEIGNCQTLELIDLNKNQDSSTFYDISLTTNDNSNDISSSKDCFIDATKNGENNTKNTLSDYPRTPQRNAAQFNRANDTQVNLEGSKQVQQPPIFESKGWL